MRLFLGGSCGGGNCLHSVRLTTAENTPSERPDNCLTTYDFLLDAAESEN